MCIELVRIARAFEGRPQEGDIRSRGGSHSIVLRLNP